MSSLEKRQYRKIKEEISKLDAKYRECLEEGRKFPQELNLRRNRLMQEFIERFPDEERWLLPTSFGNTVRAFEVYPRVMYGIDSIPAWERLLSVIPEDYRKLIDDSKTQVDFWANVWILSILFIFEYFLIALHIKKVEELWLLALAIALTFFAFFKARSAAVEWGKLVKASFDIFLPQLHKKLGFKKPNSLEEEKQLWKRFSQAVIYMDPESLPQKDYTNDFSEDGNN